MTRATLFHVKHIRAVAKHANLEVNDAQLEKLATYRDWLVTEAARSGGIGRAEINRVEPRHIADSLLFATTMPTQPAGVIDLGTGVGLPGVPLAIVMPETVFTLVDRSQRRLDLLRRAIRILDLANCRVIQGEIEDLSLRGEVVVSRASLPPPTLTPIVRRLLAPGGIAVVGGSWHHRPEYEGWSVAEIPRHVLDRPIWLLMMRAE